MRCSICDTMQCVAVYVVCCSICCVLQYMLQYNAAHMQCVAVECSSQCLHRLNTQQTTYLHVYVTNCHRQSMFIFISMHICVYIYVQMKMYIYIHIYMCVYICTYMYI